MWPHRVEHLGHRAGAMSRKPIRRCMKASTAISFAAFRIAGAPPPARSARAPDAARGSARVGRREIEPGETGEIEAG
jgi:hypothetical protein